MIKNEPLLPASPPDQHEDDAGGDVQTPDGTGDSALHIENPRGSSSVAPGEFIFLFFSHITAPEGKSGSHFQVFPLS